VHMFTDMLDAIDAGRSPMETFYDGYVVNAVMDAAYRSVESKRWEPVTLEDWRGSDATDSEAAGQDFDDAHYLVKKEKMPDGKTKLILKEKATGRIIQKTTDDQ